MDKKELFAEIQKASRPQPKKPIVLDRSPLEAYANCPYQGWCLLNGDIDEAEVTGQIGQEGHRIAERCLKEGFGNRYGGDELLTFAEDVITEIAQSRPDIQPKLIKAAKYLAEQIAHVPIDRILTDSEGKPFIEYQIDYELGKSRDGRPIVITTCVDLAYSFREDALHIVDWKFGWLKYNSTLAEEAYQTCHISYIMFQLFPDVQTIHFWYNQPRYGTKGYAYVRRNDEIPSMPHLTVEDMFLHRITSAINLYLDGVKEAWPEERKCLWCPVKHKCPHLSAALKGVPTNTKQLVDQIVVLNAWQKKHEKAATELWKKNGPLQGTKHTWEHKPSRIIPRLCKIENEDNGENED